MDKLQLNIKALTDAYKRGKLCSGSYRTCAVSALIENTGYSYEGWSVAFLNYVYGIPLPEGSPSIEYFSDLTGYSPDELVEIEAAFEGVSIVLGNRRVSMGRDEEVIDRLVRTVEKLSELDVKQEKFQVEFA